MMGISIAAALWFAAVPLALVPVKESATVARAVVVAALLFAASVVDGFSGNPLASAFGALGACACFAAAGVKAGIDVAGGRGADVPRAEVK